MTRLPVLFAAALLGAGALFASLPAKAEETCDASRPAMSKEAITKSLQDRGYTQVRSISSHHGCYEAKGIDSKGKRFELEVNAATGEIVNQE